MPANLAIHRLSAHTPARAQPVAARLALQVLGADLEDALPRRLPPQSLLWLRRLHLQAPEAALLRPAPAAWRQDWIAAGRERFDAALAQAARPALGLVPESAPAVLFADAAEMLACLALAAHGGQLDRWWWRGLLGRAWPQWQPAWAARPEAQLGAQRLLARAGQGGVAAGWTHGPPTERLPAVPAAPSFGAEGGVSPPQAFDVVERVAHDPLAPQLNDVGLAEAQPEPPRPVVTVRPGGLEHGASAPAAAAQASSLRSEQPASPAAAVPAITGAQEPSSVAAARPLHAEDGPDRLPAVLAAPGEAPPEARPVAAGARRKREVATRRSARLSDARPPAVETISPPASQPPEAVPAPGAIRDAVAPSAPVTAEPAAPPDPSLARQPPFVEDTVPAQARIDPVGPEITSSPAAWPWPQAVLSRQAPLLFVVNALLEDSLYPDFTRPRDPGLPVPLWALLAALACAWRLPADGLQAALQQRCPDWTAPEAMPAAPGAPAGTWPEWLAAYARSLRRRLCRRLGLRPAALPQALTLARPARLWLSEGEWVAEFDLDVHDVSWRLAGLDRDPGWLPASGCTLRFTFT
ncbi:hypothetical protein [Roseateles sp. LYH14W]|uniref:Uncharacterized protein n=1 Tax=Pelomonas parva TaxID=3299032 RepID=A0ABW7EY07_9BURK